MAPVLPPSLTCPMFARSVAQSWSPADDSTGRGEEAGGAGEGSGC